MRNALVAVLFAALAQNALGASLHFQGHQANPRLIPRIFEEPLNETLYCLRLMANEYLQTIQLDELNLNFDLLGSQQLTGHFNVKNFVLTDISDFVATYMSGDLNILQLAYTLDAIVLLRNVSITFEYDASFRVEGIFVEGAGQITLEFSEVTLNLHTRLAILSLSFSQTALRPNIGKFVGEITGFFHDDEQSRLITDLLNELLPHWINDQAQDISDYLSPVIEAGINEAIQGGGDDGGDAGEGSDDFWDLLEQYCPTPIAS